MAYDPLSDGDVETAAHRLANFYDQVIAQVPSSSPPPGTEGQFIYETDTNKLRGHNASTFVDFGRLSGIDTWTPQIDQGASTNIAKTTTTAMYVRIGNVVLCWTTLALTAAGSAGSSVTVTLPVAPTGYTANDCIGSGHILDASAGANSAVVSVWFSSGSAVVFQIDSSAAAGRWGVNPNIALASGDSIRFQAMYRVA
jgi:hypothetical protein